MSRSARFQPSIAGKTSQFWLLAGLLGLVISVCYPDAALAGNTMETDRIATMFAQSEVVSDQELAVISGKSNAAVLSEERLAVILWDEQGSGSQRDNVQLIQGNSGTQNIYLTVTRN